VDIEKGDKKVCSDKMENKRLDLIPKNFRAIRGLVTERQHEIFTETSGGKKLDKKTRSELLSQAAYQAADDVANRVIIPQITAKELYKWMMGQMSARAALVRKERIEKGEKGKMDESVPKKNSKNAEKRNYKRRTLSKRDLDVQFIGREYPEDEEEERGFALVLTESLAPLKPGDIAEMTLSTQDEAELAQNYMSTVAETLKWGRIRGEIAYATRRFGTKLFVSRFR
jgi:hypothetical protein